MFLKNTGCFLHYFLIRTSLIGTIFTDERKRMSPRLLKAIMLLEESAEWWSIVATLEVVELKGNVTSWETGIGQ